MNTTTIKKIGFFVLLGLIGLLAAFFVHRSIGGHISSESRAREQMVNLGLRANPATNYIESVDKYPKRVFENKGEKRSYYVYYPEGIGSNVDVLIALHGANRTGISMIDTWKATADKYRFIIVAPNAQNSAWSNSDSIDFIMNSMGAALHEKKLKAKNTYLFGHSSGGIRAIDLLAKSPDLFTKVAIHAASLPSPPIDITSGGSKQVGLFIGDSDALFPLESGRETAGWLLENGYLPTLYILQNHSHWYYDDYDKVNNAIWYFLSYNKPKV